MNTLGILAELLQDSPDQPSFWKMGVTVRAHESETHMMVKSCNEKKVFSILLNVNVKYILANWLRDLL